MTGPEFERWLRERIEMRTRLASLSPEDFRGVGEVELQALENVLELTLPDLVRRYLKRTGARIGKLRPGSSHQFAALELINRAGRETFELEGAPLPADGFILFSHQGYDYLFLRTGSGDPDPPVYRWIEGDTRPRRAFDSFVDYVDWLFSGEVL